METLTKREEEIMQILWKIKRGVVNDVISEMEEPKPPYSTISSIVRILEKKEFIGYKAYGKTYEYFPLISKAAYKAFMFKQMIKNYFEGSYENVVSFIADEKGLSERDIQDIKDIIDKKEETENQKNE